MKKRLILASAATIVGLATASGAAYAATQSTSNPDDTLVDKIATRFNLDKSEVQKVFDENREARQAERQANLEDKLKQAVTDKKLTQGQADEILKHFKEMDTLRDSLKDKTPEERREAVKAEMDEFRKWLEDNDLNLRDLGLGKGGMGHHGGHGMDGPRDES